MTWCIRYARSADLKLLGDLAVRAKAYWGYPKEMLESFRKELTYRQEDLGTGEYFVGELDGRVIGFSALVMLDAEKVELEALFVEPDCIGQGFGRKLMTFAKERAVQLGARVMLIQSDPHAVAFYQAAGGHLTGESESASVPGRMLPTLQIDL